MFFSILKNSEDEIDDDGKDDGFDPNILKNNDAMKGQSLKNKIKFVSKMLKMQNILREERENIIKIKNKNNNKLPRGILLEGKAGKFIDLFLQLLQHLVKLKKRI